MYDVSLLIDPAITIAAAFVVGSATIAGRRSARARFYAAVLDRLTYIIDASPAEMASILGISRRTLERWSSEGVPEASQSVIARVFRTAVALRRGLTPRAARQLLLLRQRRNTEEKRDRRRITAGTRNRAHGPYGVIITVR